MLALLVSCCFLCVEPFAYTIRLSDVPAKTNLQNEIESDISDFIQNISRFSYTTEDGTEISFPPDFQQLKEIGSPKIYTNSSQFSPQGQAAYQKLTQAIQNQQSSVKLPIIDVQERNQLDTILHQEHPEWYYVTTVGAGKFHTYDNSEPYEEVRISYYENNTDLKQVIADFLKDAPKNGTDYEKELYVHDKLIEDTYYEAMNYTQETLANSLRDCLVHHATSSLGYAYTMGALLNELGVPCSIVEGTFTKDGQTEKRAWNRVTLNGKPYLTDAFQDDPYGRQHSMSHRYFNLTQKEMDRDHKPDQAEQEKACTYSDQNYFRKNGLVFSSVSAAESKLKSLLRDRREAEVRLSSESLARQVISDIAAGSLGTISDLKSSSETDATNGVVSAYLV